MSSVIHRITLIRRPPSEPGEGPGGGLGFSVRGGIEHGLGHFVSTVEPGSEAHLQGLRPGDQILKVDGMSLLGSTHKEVVNLISSRPRSIDLEVRSVGVIPVKERPGDPVSWRTVDSGPEDTRIIVPQIRPSEQFEARVTIDLGKPSQQHGLGCSVCRGPPHKPGIFVQSTKPGGLARNAGIRPGDQILDCNGVSFQNADFTEAVRTLKTSRHLDLLVRKGAGADLFPGESSGYESSSASSNGSAKHDHKHRLNAVIEEDEDEIETEVELHHQVVSENRIRLEEKMIGEERKRLEEEQERLKREALRLDKERKRFEEEKKMVLKQQHQQNAVEDEAETTTDNGGLATALRKELQRRQEAKLKNGDDSKSETTTTNSMAKKAPSIHANLKNDKHDALMEEFKRAHKKMFRNEHENLEEEIVEEPSTKIPPPPSSTTAVIVEDAKKAPTTILIQPKATTANLLKPKAPPPPPPMRTSPLLTTSTTTANSSSTSSQEREDEEMSVSPGIPTPDYDSSPGHSPLRRRKKNGEFSHEIRRLSSSMSSLVTTSNESTSSQPRRKSRSRLCGVHSVPEMEVGSSSSTSSSASVNSRRHSHNHPQYMAIKSKTKTFSKRHPPTTTSSSNMATMDSFVIVDKPRSANKPPPFYFENEEKYSFNGSGNGGGKTVRFSFGEEGAIASQDYRAANAIGASAANTLTRTNGSKSANVVNGSISSVCSTSTEDESSSVATTATRSSAYQRRKQTVMSKKANGGKVRDAF